MLASVIKQLNWVDVFIIIIWIRICYVSIKAGFVLELFKLLGTLLAAYLSLHYYSSLADYLNERLSITAMPLEFLDFICFVFLAVLGYLVFMVLRLTVNRFIKTEAAPRLNKWGGLLVGVLRAYLFSSLAMFILAISTISYTLVSVQHSYYGWRVFKAAPALYAKIWNGAMSKFMAQEKFNNSVLEVEGSIQP